MPFSFRKQSADNNNPSSASAGAGGSNPWAGNPAALPGQTMPGPAPGLQPSDSYPEHIKQKIALASTYDCAYIPTETDMDDIRFEKYKRVFSSSLITNIHWLARIKDRNGKEWFVYKYEERITDDAGDPRAREAFGGYEKEYIPSIKRNNLREITEVSFDKVKPKYSIEWSREAVENVLDGAQNVPSNMVIGYASDAGSGDPWHGNEMTIHNIHDFLERDFDTLERMNKGGWSRKDGTGYSDMIKYDKEDAEESGGGGISVSQAKRMNVQKTEEAVRKAKAAQQQQQ